MKVIGIIPARYASSRFPGKPLIDLKGKTMIQRVYEGASKSSLIDEVIVATDDQRIVDDVLRFGGKVELTRADHASGTERCAEVAERHSNSNLVINIQGDEPLINFQQLDELIHEFEDPSVEIATLATPFKEELEFKNQNRIKVVLNAERDALYFSRAAIPSNSHGNSQNNLRLKHIGVYAFRRDVLLKLAKLPLSNLEQEESLEQLRWMYHLWKIRVGITQIETPNIDTPEDLQTVLNKL